MAAGSFSLTATSCSAGSNPKHGDDDRQIIFIGDNIAVADTVYDKVRGFIHKGIFNFLGIPYGANTIGKTRFMPARKPEPWSEIYPAVYLAWFGWNPPLFDGRLRAFHTMDIGFWFYNTDVQISHTGGGARPRNLAAKMAGSLAQFMKTGNPNGGGLPEWPEYTAENGETMILDDVCDVKNDPDREARKTINVS